MCTTDLISTLPKCPGNLLDSENLVRSPTAETNTALGVLQRRLNSFAGLFFKVLGIHFCR